MQWIYVQDRFIEAGTPCITAEDRSFRFGDGVFETILIHQGRMFEFPAHLARLTRGLEFFSLRLNLEALQARCEALIARNACESGYLRIIVSRGENGAGAIGYLPGEGGPLLILQTVHKDFPPYRPLRLWVSEHRASLCLPCKTNSAMLYTLAMMEARAHDCENALLLDAHGHVCETASGNLFWVKDGVLHTPEDGLPFVPGTVRAWVMAHSFLPLRMGRYMLEDLAQAEEIFMTNIGGLITPITAIEPLGTHVQGDATARQFREMLEQDIGV